MDWRKNELVFDAKDTDGNVIGEAVYVYVGDCLKCGQRCFQCKSHPIRDDVQMQGRVAALVKTSRNEPASVYCQSDYLPENPHVVEQINAGVVTEPTEVEQKLAEATKKLGGAIGGVSYIGKINA